MDTPISLINFICSQNSITPEYVLLSKEGQVHAPTFTYQVNINEHTTKASGQSKKKAKQQAARLMLNLLSEINSSLIVDHVESVKKILDNPFIDDDNACLGNNNLIDKTNDVNVKSDGDLIEHVSSDMSNNSTDIQNNPVGKLQEICMKKHWNPPVYDSAGECGLPHERVFKFICFLENLHLEQFGEGKSKKLAKRASAANMLKMLKEQNLDKVDEILDRLPRNMNKKLTFNITEILNPRLGERSTNKRLETLLEQFYTDLILNDEQMCKLRQLFPKAEKFIQNHIQNKIMANVDQTAIKLSELINCNICYTIHSEKSKHNQFICWTELITNESKYEKISIISTFGEDEELNLARERATTRCIALFLVMIIKDLTLENIN